MFSAVKIQSTGPSLTLQDGGRFGYRRFGVASAGFMDAGSAMAANSLLGNAADATCLEIALGGAVIHVQTECWLAHAGGLNCPQLAAGQAKLFSPGDKLDFQPGSGVWSYLAALGGWQAQPILGSRSFHARSGMGPKVEPGQVLQVFGYSPNNPASIFELPEGVSARHLPNYRSPSAHSSYPLQPSIHWALIDPRQLFTPSKFTLLPWSDRTGYRLRLDGADESSSLSAHQPRRSPAKLEISDHADLDSFPVMPGCIQVPPSGELLVIMRDGPTVGGYPVVACIPESHLASLAQLRPNTQIEFTPNA